MANPLKVLFSAADFRKLFAGQLISGLGDWLATFALISFIYALTGNTAQVALILVLRLVPPMFAAPVGGVLADRVSRKNIMITSDLVRAGLIVLVPFFNVWVIYVIAFVHEFVSLFFLPARDAAIPSLAPKKHLEIANGLMLATSYAMLPVAGGLFGLLHGASSIYPHFLPLDHEVNAHPEILAFFADGLTFVISALFIWKMGFRSETRRKKVHTGKNVFADMGDGLKEVWQNTVVRSLAYGLVMAMFGAGVLFAVGIGFVRETLGGSSATFGWLASLWGLGMALGLATVRLVTERRGRVPAFVACIMISGCMIIGMALVPVVWIALVLAIPFGMSFAIALVLALTIAQTSADDTLRGRVMGGVESLYRIGLGLGALSIGTLANAISAIQLGWISLDGNQFGMIISGLLILGGALLSSRLLRHTQPGLVEHKPPVRA